MPTTTTHAPDCNMTYAASLPAALRVDGLGRPLECDCPEGPHRPPEVYRARRELSRAACARLTDAELEQAAREPGRMALALRLVAGVPTSMLSEPSLRAAVEGEAAYIERDRQEREACEREAEAHTDATVAAGARS